MLSAQQFYFSALCAVVRANWVLLWLKMLRKLRQMAPVQTRVLQQEERRLAPQSGVRLGRGPAPHLLAFSKAHVQKLGCCQVTTTTNNEKQKSMACSLRDVEDEAVAILFRPVSWAWLCMQNELTGLTEVHCA